MRASRPCHPRKKKPKANRANRPPSWRFVGAFFFTIIQKQVSLREKKGSNYEQSIKTPNVESRLVFPNELRRGEQSAF